MLNQGYIYIMSNKYRTTFYVGVTSTLEQRMWQHINGEGSEFVKKYKLFDLVYFEHFHLITEAIGREKQVKNWHKAWKINLIKSMNPEMRDLKGDLDWDFEIPTLTLKNQNHCKKNQVMLSRTCGISTSSPR